jgi:predicted Zn-dependent protease
LRVGDSSILASNRLVYAQGYLALGLAREARRELQALPIPERTGLPARKLLVECAMGLKQWPQAVRLARPITREDPGYENAWIALAYALREMNQVREARETLHEALPHHQFSSGVLQYNLACYECLLGNLAEARRRLARACKLDESWGEAARSDPDLQALFAAGSDVR